MALFATGRSLAADKIGEVRALSSQEAELRARQVALSGYAEARQALTAPNIIGSSTLPALVGEHGGGRYQTTFDVNSNEPYEVGVRVEGIADRRSGPAGRHVVEGTFRAQTSVPDLSTDPTESLTRVPKYMRYAAFAGDDMRFLAFPRFRVSGNGFNSNIHANGSMNMAFTVPFGTVGEGFATYSGGILKPLFFFNPQPNFRPNLNPSKDPTVEKVQPVDFPEFTALSLLQNAAGEANKTLTSVIDLLDVVEDVTRFATELRVGRVELLGNVYLGTRENPKIIYVDGDLIVFNPRHHGYGIYIVEGNVLFEGTLSGVLSWFFGAPESHVAYYADGSVFFNGIGDVHGQIVSNRSVTFTLAPTFYGSVTAREDVSFAGLPTLRFTSPSPALTTILPGNPSVGEVMEEVSLREWETDRGPEM